LSASHTIGQLFKYFEDGNDRRLISLSTCSEYCFHGNLRDYVTRQRDYFINELDPVTLELQEGHRGEVFLGENLYILLFTANESNINVWFHFWECMFRIFGSMLKGMDTSVN
jgi:hypothetical protein